VLSRPQNQSERFGEEKNVLPHLGCKVLLIHKNIFIDIYSSSCGRVGEKQGGL
jgi:hypothetical protein